MSTTQTLGRTPNVAAWFAAHDIAPSDVAKWEAQYGTDYIVRYQLRGSTEWLAVAVASPDDFMDLAKAADRDDS